MSEAKEELARTLDALRARVELERGLGADAFPYEPSAPQDKQAQLDALRAECLQCRKCRLYQHAKNLVFGQGNPDTRLLFVGEGPGRSEDEQGLPFVGEAGQLLTKIIQAIEWRREDVYIANVVKHRPPNNRTPQPDEIAACKPYLIRQIEIIRPEVIVALGKVAAQTLLESDEGITRLRGRFYDFMGAKLMPTFHPAYLLYNPAAKRPCWHDMKQVRDALR